MCKIKGVTIGIKNLNFTAFRGKMLARLTDGREVLIPVSFFPDIQHMPVKERQKWMILDDQYFTFENMTRVYSVLDLLKVAQLTMKKPAYNDFAQKMDEHLDKLWDEGILDQKRLDEINKMDLHQLK